MRLVDAAGGADAADEQVSSSAAPSSELLPQDEYYLLKRSIVVLVLETTTTKQLHPVDANRRRRFPIVVVAHDYDSVGRRTMAMVYQHRCYIGLLALRLVVVVARCWKVPRPDMDR